MGSFGQREILDKCFSVSSLLMQRKTRIIKLDTVGCYYIDSDFTDLQAFSIMEQ